MTSLLTDKETVRTFANKILLPLYAFIIAVNIFGIGTYFYYSYSQHALAEEQSMRELKVRLEQTLSNGFASDELSRIESEILPLILLNWKLESLQVIVDGRHTLFSLPNSSTMAPNKRMVSLQLDDGRTEVRVSPIAKGFSRDLLIGVVPFAMTLLAFWIMQFTGFRTLFLRPFREFLYDMEKELEGSFQRESLSQKMAAVGVMSGGVAHEINNPLMIAIGNLELAIQEVEAYEGYSFKAVRLMNKTNDALGRVSTIVKSLLVLSQDRDSSERSFICLNEMIREVEDISREKLKNDSIKFSYEIDGKILILGDKGLIGQVFINLVNNAYDEIVGTKDPWIKIKAFRDGNLIRVHFMDSGRGLPSDIAPQVFDQFFTTKEVGKGTGLGLSLCKKIVERHQGTICYLEDKNTVFEVTFPEISPIEIAC